MKKTVRKVVIILFWIGIWMLLAFAVDNRILMADPPDTIRELASLLGSGHFYGTAAASLLRIGGGFLAGLLAGVLLAAAAAHFRLFEEFLEPLMSLLKAVPVASFVVLLLIWWGSSFLAAAVSFLVVLPNIYINTLSGLKNIQKELLEMGEVFGLPFYNRFFYLYRPALRPWLYSGMKVALGMSWKAGVAAEVIGVPGFSVGEQLYLAKLYLNTAGVFAWTAVVILLSFFFEKMILWGTDRFFAWQPVCRRPTGAKRRKKSRKRGLSGQIRTAVSGAGSCERLRGSEVLGTALYSLEISGTESCDSKTFGTAPCDSAPLETVSCVGQVRIILRGVWKEFDGRTVLSEVNQVYEQGKTYYLRSPSGSGKTTLLKLIAGLETPDTGTVEVEGKCSMVFQEDRLCEDYSAVKNVELVTGDPEGAERILGELLEPEALHIPCRNLSGGMRRRVALVRAMEADSDCVLLDEPFAGMDAATRSSAQEYIRERQRGRLLIVATHI